MNAFDAAIKILGEAEKPLHAREIVARILEAGIWTSKGKTPEATVGALIYSDIKKRGANSPFIKVAPQTFSLKVSTGTTSDSKIVPSSSTETAATTSTIPTGNSFSDCAHRVLEEFGDRKPMHYRKITGKAQIKGWLVTEGKTPEATMYAQMVSEIRRQQKRGEHPRFVQHGRGLFGLGRWMDRGLVFQIEQHNKQIRKALLERLLALKSEEFEGLVSLLLVKMGFVSVEVTKLSGDGGIDVRGTLEVSGTVHIKMAVQAKKWKPGHNIHSPVVQQVRGSLGAHEQGLIITTSGFSTGATDEAKQLDKAPIALMNGDQLVSLLVEYEIGVQRFSQNPIELKESFEVDGLS